MHSERKYSLYIPAYNAALTIGKCIKSAVIQKKPFAEIIVVNDASTDNTKTIAEQNGAMVINHDKNLGLAAARNTGIKNAKHDFIVSIDADVVLDKDFLFNIDKYFNTERFSGVSGKLIEEAGDIFSLWRSVNMKQHWGDKARFVPFMYGGISVFNRQVVENAGFYDTQYKTNFEDCDICRRITKDGGKFFYIPSAYATHIKKDTIYSLLKNFWSWQFNYYSEKNSYSDKEALDFKLKENTGLSNRLFCKSYTTGDFDSLYIDFLLSVYLSIKDIFYVFKKEPDDFVFSELMVLDAVLKLKGILKDDTLSLFAKRSDKNIFLIRMLLIFCFMLTKELLADDDFIEVFLKDMLFLFKAKDVSKKTLGMLIAFSKTDLDLYQVIKETDTFLNSNIYSEQNFIFDLKNCYNAWNENYQGVAKHLKESSLAVHNLNIF